MLDNKDKQSQAPLFRKRSVMKAEIMYLSVEGNSGSRNMVLVALQIRHSASLHDHS